MSFVWMKRYMPRSLYGRAALILILPVVTLQLVVSVVFIQRHFEGVTEQLSRETSRSVNLIARSANPADLARTLGIGWEEIRDAELPVTNQRRFYDFTGLVVIRSLFEHIPTLQLLDLPDDAQVNLYLQRDGGFARVTLDRGRVSASNPHQLLVNMVFFGALMTVIAFVYMRNQLRPITRLSEAAEAFGKGRVLPYKPSGAVEVRSAGHAFLDMRSRIERQIEQRTMMLSGVSHDLRTPLTRLRLGLSLLEDEDRAPLERDVQDMQHLIDAFLDFAQTDSEASPPERLDPVAMVATIVEDCQRAGQKVTLVHSAGQGEMAFRPMMLRRAVENLIGNSGRYAQHCEVSVDLTDAMLRIRIEDDGPGIPVERREEAMRPFVRLDPARNQDKGPGVGLGLAIAADVARAHGGVLRLGESDRLGGLRADLVIAR